jgi:hypothetical protein
MEGDRHRLSTGTWHNCTNLITKDCRICSEHYKAAEDLCSHLAAKRVRRFVDYLVGPMLVQALLCGALAMVIPPACLPWPEWYSMVCFQVVCFLCFLHASYNVKSTNPKFAVAQEGQEVMQEQVQIQDTCVMALLPYLYIVVNNAEIRERNVNLILKYIIQYHKAKDKKLKELYLRCFFGLINDMHETVHNAKFRIETNSVAGIRRQMNRPLHWFYHYIGVFLFSANFSNNF